MATRNWQTALLDSLAPHLPPSEPTHTTHLAILVEPYLSLLLAGKKTVESRFSRTRRAPFQQANPGDTLLIKRPSGPVVAACTIAATYYFQLDERLMEFIRARFAVHLGLASDDDSFWRDRATMRYASIFPITDVRPLPPTPCHKRDQRGWVVLPQPSSRPTTR